MIFDGMYVQKEVVEDKWYLEMSVSLANRLHFGAVDRDGDGILGGILFTMDSGGIKRMKNVRPELGLALDDEGRIKVE